MGREQAPIASVTQAEIESYLSKFKGQSYSTHLNRINSLFSYAELQGWIHRNPLDRIERPRIDRKAPRILTPDEVDLLIKNTPTVCLPYLVVCLFCGVRPAEAEKLDWRDISLEESRIVIGEAASKVRQRRVAPIPARGLALLQAHPVRSGKLCPSSSTLRRCRRKIRALLGHWHADILRHTAASYLLAVHEDAGKVSLWLGNSATILLRHYNGVASKKDAQRFFAA